MINALPGNVIDKQCSDGTAVVGAGNRPEILLASGVPDLELDVFVIDGNSFGPEFDSDCDIVGNSGLVLDELKYDTGFPNT